MLQTIRERTQGWIAGIIISIIILTFALWGIHSYFVSNGANSVVAVVNGVEISREQLATAYERLRRQVQSQFGADALKDDNTLKSHALNGLVELEVLKQASIKEGFGVSDAQVDNYLQNMPEFQVEDRFSLEKFQEVLASSMLSVSEFLDIIRTSLLIDQPRLGLMLTSFALQDEAVRTIMLVDQERDIDYVSIPLKHFLSLAKPISSERIAAYYKAHQKDFMTPEQVNLNYIELTLKDLSFRVTPTEKELRSFYNETLNSYTQPMAWQLEAILLPVPASPTAEDWQAAQTKANVILTSLRKGESFTELAKQHAGADISDEMLALNQLPVALQKAVAGLSTKGAQSQPIRTSKGIVILKAVDIREPKIQTFEQVQNKVRETYVRQHAEEKFAEMRDQLADLTYANPSSLQTAASDLGLVVKETGLITKDKQGDGIAQYKKIRDAGFGNEVMNLQNNSDVIQINPETIAVVHLKSHVASKILPLQEVTPQIIKVLTAEEADASAAKYAETLKQQLDQGGDPATLVAEKQFVWTKLGYIGRHSTKVDSAVLDASFRLPSSNDGKPIYGVTRLPGGYGVVALRGVKSGELDDKKVSVFSEQVQNSQGVLEYQLYKESLMNHAKIKHSA